MGFEKERIISVNIIITYSIDYFFWDFRFVIIEVRRYLKHASTSHTFSLLSLHTNEHSLLSSFLSLLSSLFLLSSLLFSFALHRSSTFFLFLLLFPFRWSNKRKKKLCVEIFAFSPWKNADSWKSKHFSNWFFLNVFYLCWWWLKILMTIILSFLLRLISVEEERRQNVYKHFHALRMTMMMTGEDQKDSGTSDKRSLMLNH